MKTIDEYTNYLFNCCFTDDAFDPEDHEDHLKMSWELFDNYSWEDIYPVWVEYLHTKCDTPEDVINFVNLYIYYEAADQTVPNPIEFISYLYFKVDMDKYWDEAGDLFDGLAINILSKQGLVNTMENPYYNPLKDERILSGISAWKSI
ncbi:MAG: hypothetical protein ACI4J9_00465 [Mogibacterium kristiansenii]|uniref:hypothetical protein n=1 Tax=Mogibacterium kristiansenii TaxID=2606708 RepID=UPI003F053565